MTRFIIHSAYMPCPGVRTVFALTWRTLRKSALISLYLVFSASVFRAAFCAVPFASEVFSEVFVEA